MESMELGGTVRVIEKSTYAETGMSDAEYKEALRLFNKMRRESDPFCGAAKKVAFIPQKVTRSQERPHLTPHTQPPLPFP